MFIFHISGNASTLYKNMVDAELQQGNSVNFLYYYLHRGTQTESAINFENLCCYQVNSMLRGPVLYLKRLNDVAKFAKNCIQDTPDLLYAHMLFSSGHIARRMHTSLGIPFIVAVRNTDLNLWFLWKFPWIRLSGYRTLREAKTVVFLSEQYKINLLRRLPQELSEIVKKKSLVLPNGIDPFWHKNIVELPKQIEDNCVRLISVGRIERNKNQVIVRAAMEILRRKGYSLSYTVIGDIIDQEMARKLNEDENTRVISYKTKEEQLAYYRDADIFIMPSVHETFGLVYAEAMSQGLPVIYTKGEGFDGQFSEGAVGYHVNCMSAEEIAEAIEKIVKDYSNISERCLEGARKFDWNRITRAYLYE